MNRRPVRPSRQAGPLTGPGGIRGMACAAGLPADYWFIRSRPATDLTNPGNWGQGLWLTDSSFDMETAPLSGVKAHPPSAGAAGSP
jgi:hypothetical protein